MHLHPLGLLWELWPLLDGTEPASTPDCSSLHPPAAARLAHSHCHEDGAADVHEQVLVRSDNHPSPASDTHTAGERDFKAACTSLGRPEEVYMWVDGRI